MCDLPVLDVFSQRHRLVHEIQPFPEAPLDPLEFDNVRREVALPPLVPLGDLLEVDVVALQPDPEGVAPFREELGLEQLRRHAVRHQRSPREDRFDRRQFLRPRVDHELVPEERAERRQNVLEEQRVPVGFRKRLSSPRARPNK